MDISANITSVIKALLNGLSDLVYPPNCLICKKFIITRLPGEILCPHCRQFIEFNLPPFCVQCSRPLRPSSLRKICRECLHLRPHFDTAIGCCRYNDMLKHLIYQFKYGNKLLLRRSFAELMVSFVEQHGIHLNQFDLIVPIPLSSTRQRERGYNQSQLLAEHIGLKYSLKLSTNNLLRTRHTTFQAQLSIKERWTNIHGAFRIKHPSEFQNKSVLVIDDLLTTGATASEGARVLKEAGAIEVGVLTLAIA